VRNRSSAVTLSLILAGCTTLDTTSEAAGPHETTVQYDETAHIGRLQVTPLDMVEDSRCPQGVQCIWAGRVRLKVTLVEGGQRSEPVLTMNEPLMTSGGGLMLIAASPYPSTTAKYAKSAYRFTFGLDRQSPARTSQARR